MFGIGFPELILIMALALIVIGPDKLPDLARSMAKTIMDLKKTAEGLKDALKEEGNPLDDIRPDLEEAAQKFRTTLLESPPTDTKLSDDSKTSSSTDNAAKAYQELMERTVEATRKNDPENDGGEPESENAHPIKSKIATPAEQDNKAAQSSAGKNPDGI